MAIDVGGAVTAGLADVAEYNRDRPAREARNAQANRVKEQAEAELRAGVPQAKADVEMEKLRGELASAQQTNMRQITFNAFDRYTADNNVSHLNTFLRDARKQPAGNMFEGIVRVDALSNTPEVQAKLGQLGIDNPEFYLSHPELSKSKLLGTKPDGSQELIDLNKVYAGTGYTDYMQSKQLKQLQTQAAVDQALYGTGDNSMIRRIAEERKISLTEAAAEFYKLKKPAGSGSSRGGSSTIERVAQRVLAENPGMSELDALEEAQSILTSGSETEREAERLAKESGTDMQDEYRSLRNVKERTGTRKKLDETKVVRKEIDELAGGDFLAKDVDPAARRRIGEKITEIEALTGKELSQKDKESAKELRSLFALGDKAAAELQPEMTGFIDNTLHNVKKYFSDSTSGVEADSAYATFRNFARNALMGASLTAGESAEFNKASGTLKQQLGPVMAEMKVQLGDLKNKLQSVYDFNDEYVAQYYLGTSLEQAHKSMAEIDKRIKFLDSASSGLSPEMQERAAKLANPANPASPAKPKLSNEEAQAKLKGLFGAPK